MGDSCSKDTGVIVSSAPQQQAADDCGGDFLPFSQLNDDVLLCILSYVSYAPFERDVSGTMTLSDLTNPESTSRPDDEIKRLLQDYNAGATKLNKKVFKRKSSIPPFRAAQDYYNEAFHGSGTSSRSDNVSHLSRINSSRTFGTLTHVLPLVNKRFRLLCNQSDVLWTEALERLIGLRNSQEARSDIGSSVLWKAGLLSFLRCNDNADNVTHSEHERSRGLITKACECVSKGDEERQDKSSVAKEVFRQVLIHHKPTCLPVFSMFCPAVVGEELTIRLFEPRYQLMITELMADRSERERGGLPLTTPRPRFLFACRSDTWRRAVACIVEVRRCLIHPDGIAHIAIVPVSWVILEKLQRRPETGGLLDGIVMRSPKRMQLPAFCMRTHLILEQPIRLRLYEERYKTLISEVMAGRTDEERSGSPISEPRPQFVFVRNNRFREGDVASLVDVESCQIHSDGTARVTVVPTLWVLVESIRKRPNSGQLYDASILYPLPPLSQD